MHTKSFIALMTAVVLTTFSSQALASARTTRPSVGKTTMVLCAPTAATRSQMKHVRVVVSRRVRHGFHFTQATVSVSGNCLTIQLAHPIGWIRWLADDVASQGHFGIGVAYPDAKQALASGQYVRYTTDPVTSYNQNLPEVKVALGRPSFIGWSAKLVTRSGYEYVGVDLKPKGSAALCRFTQSLIGGLAVVVLDRQVITDEQVTVKICGGKLLTGFPKSATLDKPLGPRELVADLHSGPALAVPLTVTSLS